MQVLLGKKILLGVCGSIAAYKSAEIIRQLRSVGAEVRVVMTESAKAFISELSLQALSGHPVRSALIDVNSEAAMGHIELARWADLVLIAPATQDVIARLAIGRANDLLTTLCAVSTSTIILAPAMNHSMWTNAATQANRATLIARGVVVLEPDTGDMACGEFGPGRLVSANKILSIICAQFQAGLLTGVNVLLTAGPTREAIDPVRFLTNRSSGKMGYALAQAAVEFGANVTLISGPVCLPVPEKVKCINVLSADEMAEAVLGRCHEHQILVAAAAVADYKPVEIHRQKLKKDSAKLKLELERTRDILAEVARLNSGIFVVGFAAETQNLKDNAQAKMLRKNMNMIAANLVGENLGFEQQDNALEVFWQGGQKSLPQAAKTKLARQLMELLADCYFKNK